METRRPGRDERSPEPTPAEERARLHRNIAVGATSIAGVAALFAYPTSLGQFGQSILGTDQVSAASATDSGNGSASSGSGSSGSGSSGDSGSSGQSELYTGDEVQTRYGPVQVQITVQDGRIASANVTEVPGDPHSRRINDVAVPLLNQEAVSAQSARIDGVSGATITSDAYVRSLQSAIDQAHL